MQKLETIFRCPFCQHENSVGCSFNKVLRIGEISCSICSANYETRITPLTEPIDMYCEWMDECQRVNTKPQAPCTFFCFVFLKKFALVLYVRKFTKQSNVSNVSFLCFQGSFLSFVDSNLGIKNMGYYFIKQIMLSTLIIFIEIIFFHELDLYEL